MRAPTFALVCLLACASPTAPHGGARYALSAYEGARVPVRVGGEEIRAGWIQLEPSGAFSDILDRSYTDARGAVVAVRDSFGGTWERAGDSLTFRITEPVTYAYGARIERGAFTLYWRDARAVRRAFTYVAK